MTTHTPQPAAKPGPFDTDQWHLAIEARWRPINPGAHQTCPVCNGNGEVGGGFKSLDGPESCPRCFGVKQIFVGGPTEPQPETMPDALVDHMRRAYSAFCAAASTPPQPQALPELPADENPWPSEAEQLAFERHALCVVMGFEDEAYKRCAWLGWSARAALAQPPMERNGTPAFPLPYGVQYDGERDVDVPLFCASQMIEFARAALAQPPEEPTGIPAQSVDEGDTPISALFERIDQALMHGKDIPEAYFDAAQDALGELRARQSPAEPPGLSAEAIREQCAALCDAAAEQRARQASFAMNRQDQRNQRARAVEARGLAAEIRAGVTIATQPPAPQPDDWRRAAQAAVSHLDYPSGAPRGVCDALRNLLAAMIASDSALPSWADDRAPAPQPEPAKGVEAPKFEIARPNDETLRLYVNGAQVGEATHDSVGWHGMDAVSSIFERIAAELLVQVTRRENDE